MLDTIIQKFIYLFDQHPKKTLLGLFIIIILVLGSSYYFFINYENYNNLSKVEINIQNNKLLEKKDTSSINNLGNTGNNSIKNVDNTNSIFADKNLNASLDNNVAVNLTNGSDNKKGINKDNTNKTPNNLDKLNNYKDYFIKELPPLKNIPLLEPINSNNLSKLNQDITMNNLDVSGSDEIISPIVNNQSITGDNDIKSNESNTSNDNNKLNTNIISYEEIEIIPVIPVDQVDPVDIEEDSITTVDQETTTTTDGETTTTTDGTNSEGPEIISITTIDGNVITITTTDGTTTTTIVIDGNTTTTTTTDGITTTTIVDDGNTIITTTTDGTITTTISEEQEITTTTTTDGVNTTSVVEDGTLTTITTTDGTVTTTIIEDSSIPTTSNEDQPTIIDEYFENVVSINTGNDIYKPIKVATSSIQSPIYPVPALCPSGYSKMGVYSNISALSTIQLPYFDEDSVSIDITNEYVKYRSLIEYYYKVFNVNGVKIGGVTYKTVNPDINYYRAFTICLLD